MADDRFMTTPRSGPYIWVAWLSRLMVGERSCEWASWFKAHYKNYARVPSTFDSAAWQMRHTALLNEVRIRLERDTNTAVFTEGQNHFNLRGSSGTMLSGRPDLVALRAENEGRIYDIKTGQPKASDHVQVMIYMYALPHAFKQYREIAFDGMVVYEDHEAPVPSSATDEAFKDNLAALIRRIAADAQARRVPSVLDCRFCDITVADCPERIEKEEDEDEDVQEVDDF